MESMLEAPSSETPEMTLARRVAHLQTLHRIGVALASTMKPDAIGKLMLDEAMQLTGAACAVIYFRDQQTQLLVPKLHEGWGDRLPLPLDLLHSDDLAVVVALTGKPRQHTFHEAGDCAASEETGSDMPPQCRLCIPLVAGDEVLGVIDLRAPRCTRIDEDMEEMLATLASQAALIMRNASTHAELEQHYREISLLYEVQQEISSTFDYQKVLGLIVQRTRQLLNAAECTIRLVEKKPGEKRFVRIAATTGRRFIGPDVVPFEEAHLERQVFGGDMIYMEDVRTDPRFPDPEDADAAGVVSLICAPLVSRRLTIGTIRVYTSERTEFSVADRKMLLAIAGQAATSIEHARLYRKVEEKNQQLSASYEALRSAQKELVKNEKLAALGEMAATVAHEIRNPLTSVRGFAQRISRKYGAFGDGRLTQYTEIIMQEVDRLNKFIVDVLDFARRAKPSFEMTDVNRLSADVLNLMHDQLTDAEITMLPDLDMNLRSTVLDRALIKQAMLNILHNARQAAGRGGILTLKTQNSGDFIRIRITDNGPGISREALAKIWTPFYTSKTHGTGLGLSLVQRIVDDHHGRVTLRSRPGTGTFVTIYLPVVETSDAFLRPR